MKTQARRLTCAEFVREVLGNHWEVRRNDESVIIGCDVDGIARYFDCCPELVQWVEISKAEALEAAR